MNYKKRLLIVSNRLPYQIKEETDQLTLTMSSGGLVSALLGYLENSSEDFSEMLWIGNADFTPEQWEIIEKQPGIETSHIKPIFIQEDLKEKHYSGFSNSTLWPHFHYFSTFTKYDHDEYKAYREVNKLFCTEISKHWHENDVIWVHDYQLLLLPQMIRKTLPGALVGFFLHIPFPSFEIYRMLPREWREELLTGILGADLIGFHTNEYVLHFQKSVHMLLGFQSEQRIISVGNRIVRTDLFPISIDFERFNGAYDYPEIKKLRDKINDFAPRVQTIFSVDRLDYTKGLLNRVKAYELFLERNPNWHEKVTFNLVVVPSRDIIFEYSENKRKLEELVGRVNGAFGKLDWQPIIYQYRSLSFEELCASYTSCDIALITPVRDGMNLVSKEFVASRKDLKGVLILSEMAGSAAELGEALLINPTDLDEMVNAIVSALSMPLELQQRNLKIMQERIKTYDVTMWAHDFITQLDEIKELQSSRKVREIGEASFAEIKKTFDNALKRMLFLDYDGTLMPFRREPRMARPNEIVLRMLRELCSDERNVVTIISGRDHKTLEEWLGQLPINIIAEHGAIRKLANHKSWEYTEKEFKADWKEEIKHQMKVQTHRCANTFIEEKDFALAWHYRNAESDLGFLRSRELIDSLNRIFNNNIPLQVIDGNKVVEVRVAGIDKGAAAKQFCESFPADFILAIGDDRTDEDMFKALNHQGYTIKVGNENSEAQYNFNSISDVLPFFFRLLAKSKTSL
jgi:trehalose 6-phosphate synthase/phosphatase